MEKADRIRELNRDFCNSGTFSIISGTVGGILLLNWLNLAKEGELFLPIAPMLPVTIAIFLRYRYHSAAPPAEESIH